MSSFTPINQKQVNLQISGALEVIADLNVATRRLARLQPPNRYRAQLDLMHQLLRTHSQLQHLTIVFYDYVISDDA